MFGIGMPEFILIAVVALIVFGPKKLPELAKSMGRAMREFRKATSELKETMQVDGELSEVKKAFTELQSEVNATVNKEAAGLESPAAPLARAHPGPGAGPPSGRRRTRTLIRPEARGAEESLRRLERRQTRHRRERRPSAADDETGLTRTPARPKAPHT